MEVDLYTRHNELPLFSHYASSIDANYYNHVQVALNHLGEQIRFRIPKLKHLDLILQRDAWVVVDHVLNDFPIIGWTLFETEHRENLHESIKCEVRTWHASADLIHDRTLEAMELVLGEELAENLPDDSSVIPFKKQ